MFQLFNFWSFHTLQLCIKLLIVEPLILLHFRIQHCIELYGNYCHNFKNFESIFRFLFWCEVMIKVGSFDVQSHLFIIQIISNMKPNSFNFEMSDWIVNYKTLHNELWLTRYSNTLLFTQCLADDWTLWEVPRKVLRKITNCYPLFYIIHIGNVWIVGVRLNERSWNLI